MAAQLKRRFRSHDEAEGQPRYLDRNVASVPSLAVDALRRETFRLGRKAMSEARIGIARMLGRPPPMETDGGYEQLSRAIQNFVAGVSRGSMSASTAQAMAMLLRVHHYYDSCHELGSGLFGGHEALGNLSDADLRQRIESVAELADRLLLQLDPAHAPFAELDAPQAEQFESDYQALKAALLAAGADGRLDIEGMDALLRSFSALRRTVQQAAKAARLLVQLAPP